MWLTLPRKRTATRAQLALDMYELRILKYIGAYAAELNGVDIIAFTGGVGEEPVPDPQARLPPTVLPGGQDRRGTERYHVAWQGGWKSACLTARSKVVVVLTDEEEYMIAHDTEAIVEAREP